MPEVSNQEINLGKYEIESTKGSGAGGQHRNKNETAILLRHESGLVIKAQAYKSQKQNKELALSLLAAKLRTAKEEKISLDQNKNRLLQIGTGQRGDKRRTIRTQDNQVKDIDGREWKWSDYRTGNW